MPGSKRSAVSFPDFSHRFLKELDSNYRHDPLVRDILKDEALRLQCAAFLSLCVHESINHRAETSETWIAYWNSKFNDAIRGLKAAANIYTHIEGKPGRAKILGKLLQEILEIQRRRQHALQPTIPSKWLGRDRDWTLVQYAKDNLEPLFRTRLPRRKSILRKGLPHRTLAALLNAALKASEQEKQYSAEAVQRALGRLKKKTLNIG
jgi:hypothetical protein